LCGDLAQRSLRFFCLVDHTRGQGPNVTRRTFLGLLAAGAGLLPSVARADPWAGDTPVGPEWVSTLDSGVSLRAGPTSNAERLASVRSGTVMRVLGRELEWAQVYDPHGDMTAYVRRDLITAAQAPAMYAYLPGPAVDEELSTVAIATDDTPVYFFPSLDPRAQATTVAASDRESIVGAVVGENGLTWLRTDDGYFLPAEGVFVASMADEFSGRWLDVTLSGATRVVAHDEGDAVRSFYAIKGTQRYPTPLGVWSIVRRVANETMDSATVGIPRNAPGGYFLKNVLYTQYFRGTGESLHYNWWSSAWGTQGSHGCLGLSLADSRWLWDWAMIGTPVLIHP
jgi:hypothetical protein